MKRLNKLEEKVNRRRGGASSSSGGESGSGDASRSRSRGSNNGIDRISEEDEDHSEDEDRKKRRIQKDKILKGSSSMDDLKGKNKLDQIEEEKEGSIKSIHTPSNKEDARSKNSSRAKSYLQPPALSGGGGVVSKEFEQQMEAKFEDI